MIELVGYVKSVERKHGTSKKTGKPYTLFNVDVTGKDGSQQRFSTFDLGPIEVTKWIKTQVEENGNYLNHRGAPIQVADGPAPATAAATPAAPAAAGETVAKDDKITFMNAHTAAINLVGILAEQKALPISTDKSKAGEAKRFEQIIELREKLAVQIYQDIQSLRLLEKHDDAGVVQVDEPEPLPDQPGEEQMDAFESETFDDDIPF